MTRRIFYAWLFSLALAPASYGQQSDSLSPRVAQLSAASYATRETAMRDLAAAGPEAILELATAVYSSNPEIRWRAAKLLEEIGAGGDERTLSKVTRVLQLLGEQGMPGLLTKSNGLLHRWRETQAARVIARLEQMGAQVSTYGEMETFGFSVEDPAEETGEPTAAVSTSAEQESPRLSVDDLRTAVAGILNDTADIDQQALENQTPPPTSGAETNDVASDLDVERVIVAMGANGRVIVQPHGGMLNPGGGQVARAIVLDKNWTGGLEGIRMVTQVNNVRMLTLQSLELSAEILDRIGQMPDLQYLLIERCAYQADDMFAFRRKYEISRGPAARFSLRITGLGFLGVMGPLDGTDNCIISQVVDDSAAAVAGIQVGDRIVSINGRALNNFQDLITLVACLAPGTEIEVEVERDGEKLSAKATLQPRPPVYE